MNLRSKQKLLDLAELIDAFRIVPRILVTAYCYMLYTTTQWFMTLPEPSNSQAMFISILWGGGAAIFGLYTSSGRQWGQSFKTFPFILNEEKIQKNFSED